MISTKILATLAIAFGTISTGVFSFVGNASAANTDSHTSLIERLVSKFNLNKSDVEGTFNEHRAEKQAKMQERFTERLDKAVEEGKITEAQKSLILAKHEELRKEREASLEIWRGMTREERKASMEKRREELDAWRKANNIPEGIFGLGMGKGRGMGHCGR